jgi:hypothetical protein
LEYYALALDEGTYVSESAQLAIFLTGFYDGFSITEEMVAFVPLKGTTESVICCRALRLRRSSA